jgi:hypothetical protein
MICTPSPGPSSISHRSPTDALVNSVIVYNTYVVYVRASFNVRKILVVDLYRSWYQVPGCSASSTSWVYDTCEWDIIGSMYWHQV